MNIFNNLFEHPDKYTLRITKNLEDKIRLLCALSPNLEWSGVLFYTVTGEFNKENPLVITADDLCLCDIGTSAYTEFETKPEVVTYMCDNNLISHYFGLIHSHNKMATFFSGTDLNTLEAEGKSTPHFLSLIVNNEGSYTAAITRQEKRTFVGDVKAGYPSFGGQIVSAGVQHKTFEDTKIVYHKLDIDIEESSYRELTERFDEIQKEKRGKEKQKQSFSNSYKWNSTTSLDNYNPAVSMPPKHEEQGTLDFEYEEPLSIYNIAPEDVERILSHILDIKDPFNKCDVQSLNKGLKNLEERRKRYKNDKTFKNKLKEEAFNAIWEFVEVSDFEDDALTEAYFVAIECASYLETLTVDNKAKKLLIDIFNEYEY